MKYLAITNDNEMKMIKEFLEKNNISFFEYSSPEERMLVEIVCDSLDMALNEYNLSADDISELEDKIIDKAVEKLVESDDTFKELEEFSLEITKETLEEELDLGILTNWSYETTLSKSVLLNICDIIRDFYKTPDIDISECFEIFKSCCSIWDSPEEFCDYMSEGIFKVSTDELNNFFVIGENLYLACM